MKKYRFLTIALAGLMIAGCGSKENKPEAPEQPEDTPYINTQPENSAESGQSWGEIFENSVETHKTKEEYLDEHYERIGNFFFSEYSMEELEQLPKDEPITFVLFNENLNEDDEKATKLGDRINEITYQRLAAEDESSEEIQTIKSEQDEIIEELRLLKVKINKDKCTDTYELCSSMGYETKLRKMTSIEDGETYEMYLTTATMTLNELWELAEKVEGMYTVGKLGEPVAMRFDEIVMENKP